MFKKIKKIKKYCTLFLLNKSETKSRIEFLENRVRLLSELNNCLYVVASRSTSAYVDKVLEVVQNND